MDLTMLDDGMVDGLSFCAALTGGPCPVCASRINQQLLESVETAVTLFFAPLMKPQRWNL